MSIDRQQAVAIALQDARTAYRRIEEDYEPVARLESDGWHIEFQLKSADLDGGGPKYVIDQRTGKITMKRYEQ